MQDESRPTSNPTIGDVLQKRFERRELLGGLFKVIPAAALMGSQAGAAETSEPPAQLAASAANEAAKDSRITFQPIALSQADSIGVPIGYDVGVLARWGDPLLSTSPVFDPNNQTPQAQAVQFGYNNDWMEYFSLPGHDVKNPSRGLLVVNHEYTNPELMFKNYSAAAHTPAQTDIELNAHGLTVMEIARMNTGEWYYIQGSQYNRRITGFTPMQITGPAAGSALLKTSADQSGTQVLGTLNNCAGGKTPWGTALSGEENFQQYFSNNNALPDGPVKTLHAGMGISGGEGRPWARHYDRFDVSKEPNEPFRFGWVIEFDPYDPTSTPKKRTALGRVKHEGCAIQIARDGKVVAYTGDDERFQFAYKFVSNGTYNPFDRQANDGLLDDGTLYVARFNEDGTGDWLPLAFGQGPLTAENGFTSQADVCINTRGAATRVGATPMDRPEDFEVNPVNGKVYLALTNNTQRDDSVAGRETNAANPRANNRYGHIMEITEDNGDHASTKFFWDVFILCGDGKNPDHAAFFAGFDPAKVSTIACPDNVAFDSKGNLWIATDGQPGTVGGNDGIYAVPTDGEERGYVRQLVSTVVGAEAASMVFNPDDTALFVSVQHPGEGGAWTDDPDDLASTFPEGAAPNKPAILTIYKKSGNPVIGT